ncbi:MAG: hypothetical protein JRN24_00660 [Nitrososphaerota archaeon]|nr:hypothetical protein [Nitrososphaerota archaeon]
MGRTVPSFRIAEAQEVDEWKTFRRALPKRERPIFDEMLSTARLYTSASSAALRTSRFEGMAMAIVLHHQRILEGCVEALDRRELSERSLLSMALPFNMKKNDGHGESIEQIPGGDTRKDSEGGEHQPWR